MYDITSKYRFDLQYVNNARNFSSWTVLSMGPQY